MMPAAREVPSIRPPPHVGHLSSQHSGAPHEHVHDPMVFGLSCTILCRMCVCVYACVLYVRSHCLQARTAAGARLRGQRPLIPPPMELQVCSHVGKVRLQWFDGAQHLVHGTTAEVVALPRRAAPLQWTLHFDEDGDAFVGSGNERKWADDEFRLTVCHDGPAEGPQGVLYVVEASAQGGATTKTLLDSWLASYLGGLAYDLALKPGYVRLELSLVRVAKHQCALLWGLNSIHTGLELRAQGGKAGRWSGHGTPAWRKFLTMTLGFDDVHMPQLHGGGGRSVDGRKVSTYGLIALLSRWCSDDHSFQFRIGEDREAARRFFVAMVALAFKDGGEKVLSLFAEVAPKWDPPFLPEGTVRCDIPVVGAVLHLKEAFGRCEGLAAALGRACDGPPGAIHITTALIKMSTLVKAPMLRSVFKQLVVFVARHVEAEIADEFTFDDAQKLGDMSARRAMQGLTRYLLAARSNFADPQTLHLAVDGSTVGKKAILCGLMARPDNLGIVLPPLVGQGLHPPSPPPPPGLPPGGAPVRTLGFVVRRFLVRSTERGVGGYMACRSRHLRFLHS